MRSIFFQTSSAGVHGDLGVRDIGSKLTEGVGFKDQLFHRARTKDSKGNQQ